MILTAAAVAVPMTGAFVTNPSASSAFTRQTLGAMRGGSNWWCAIYGLSRTCANAVPAVGAGTAVGLLYYKQNCMIPFFICTVRCNHTALQTTAAHSIDRTTATLIVPPCTSISPRDHTPSVLITQERVPSSIICVYACTASVHFPLEQHTRVDASVSLSAVTSIHHQHPLFQHRLLCSSRSYTCSSVTES